nr:hypothetical protein [Elizabethkingia sp. ASV34]
MPDSFPKDTTYMVVVYDEHGIYINQKTRNLVNGKINLTDGFSLTSGKEYTFLIFSYGSKEITPIPSTMALNDIKVSLDKEYDFYYQIEKRVVSGMAQIISPIDIPVQLTQEFTQITLEVNALGLGNITDIKASFSPHYKTIDIALTQGKITVQGSPVSRTFEFDSKLLNAPNITSKPAAIYSDKEITNGKLSLTINGIQAEVSLSDFVFKPNRYKLKLIIKSIYAIKDISTGYGHVLVLTRNGEVYAAGDCFSHGRLGQGAFLNIGYLPPSIKRVYASWEQSFVVDESGRLYVTGNNAFGQLGIRVSTTLNATADIYKFIEVKGISDLEQVATGTHHTFIITKSKKLYATGRNDFGQLGLGDNTNRSSFTEVDLSGISGSVDQVDASEMHTLIKTSDGNLYGTGNNTYGELGSAVKIGSSINRFGKIPFEHGKIKDIACASTAYNFIVTESGELYGFGQNTWGQLGTGNTNAASPITKINLPFTKKIKSITALRVHSFIVTEDGELYAAGNNDFKKLGLSDGNRTSFEKVPLDFKVEKLASGESSEHFTFLQSTTGKIYAAGSNYAGELGGITAFTVHKLDGFREVPFPSNILPDF